jgi:hypothetical protein
MIAQLTATITLKERAIRQAQERFGVEVYPLMSPVWKGEEVEKLLRTKKQFVEKKETELRVMRQELAEIRKRKKEGSSIAAGQGGEKADSTDGGMSYMTNGISLATDEAVKALVGSCSANRASGNSGNAGSIVFVDSDGGTISTKMLAMGNAAEEEEGEDCDDGGRRKQRGGDSEGWETLLRRDSREGSARDNGGGASGSRAWASDMKTEDRRRRKIEF